MNDRHLAALPGDGHALGRSLAFPRFARDKARDDPLLGRSPPPDRLLPLRLLRRRHHHEVEGGDDDDMLPSPSPREVRWMAIERRPPPEVAVRPLSPGCVLL